MLSHGFHDAPMDDPNTDNLCLVKVTVGPGPELNDLVSALATEFAPPERAGKLKSKGGAKRHVIFEPSDIVAFQLVRDGGAPPTLIAEAQRHFPPAAAAVFLFDANGRPHYDGLFMPGRRH